MGRGGLGPGARVLGCDPVRFLCEMGPFIASAPQTGVSPPPPTPLSGHAFSLLQAPPSAPGPASPGKPGISQPFAGEGLAGGLRPGGSYLKGRQPSCWRSEAARAAGCRRGPAAGARGTGMASSCACCCRRLMGTVERKVPSRTPTELTGDSGMGRAAGRWAQPAREDRARVLAQS